MRPRQGPTLLERRAYAAIRILRKRAQVTGDPLSAAQLAPLLGVPEGFAHESARRLVREVIHRAREILHQAGAPDALTADGHGYRLTVDRDAIAQYLRRRRRQGLAHLAAHAEEARSAAAASSFGQGMLFVAPPPSSSAMLGGL